jgi:response regulator RpfG family c-di-GMP phosphodiesterase
MTSQRSYKMGKMTEDEAMEEIERSAGTQFDPELTEVFVRLRRSAAFLNVSKRPA